MLSLQLRPNETTWPIGVGSVMRKKITVKMGLALGVITSAFLAVAFLYGLERLVTPQSSVPESSSPSPSEPIRVTFLENGVQTAAQSRQCQEAKSTITTLLDEGKTCERDSDCVLSTRTLCPFGCFRAFNRKVAEDVEYWFDQYARRDCSTCVYRCRILHNGARAECIEGTCRVDNSRLETKAALKSEIIRATREHPPDYEKPAPLKDP